MLGFFPGMSSGERGRCSANAINNNEPRNAILRKGLLQFG
jgi:hypothetical protein